MAHSEIVVLVQNGIGRRTHWRLLYGEKDIDALGCQESTNNFINAQCSMRSDSNF